MIFPPLNRIQRQYESKSSTADLVVECRDGSIMRFNDRLAYTKSKTYAAMGIAAVCMSRDKAFKNMFQQLRRNASAVIFDLKNNVFPRSSFLTRMQIFELSFVWLTALSTRLTNACTIRRPSAGTVSNSSGMSMRQLIAFQYTRNAGRRFGNDIIDDLIFFSDIEPAVLNTRHTEQILDQTVQPDRIA